MRSFSWVMVGHRFHMGSNVKWLGLLLSLFVFTTAGCSLIKLKKEVTQSMESSVLVGRISTDATEEGMIVVVAYEIEKGTRNVAHYTVLHGAGEYELMVPMGEYYICAYWDNNGNLIYDDGESAGQYGDPKRVSAPAGGVVLELNFSIQRGRSDIELPTGFVISRKRPHRLKSRQAGAIVDLDDERFSADNGGQGFWEPLDFFKRIGGNIYFLEEYDPKKIPILFVHGAGGTPKGWDYFINNIDRKRFQPWLFYYPTGGRLKSMSYLLYWKLYNLQIKYKFDTLYITAHSMGGLVARSLIMDYGRYTPYIKLFIALATPWGGDRMAEYGVKQSPAVIPSWIDLQPEGEFIQSLFRDKLPDRVAFYMFTGHRGSRNPFRANNDGTITLASLLDWRAQSEAKMNYAFNEDHASIVESPAVLTQYNTIINTFERDKRTTQIAGGYIEIGFTYDFPLDGSRPRPILVLQPDGRRAAATEIHLSPDDSGRRLGPFPAGAYTASMMAAAIKPDKHHVPVSIESDGTYSLQFSLAPDGMVYGHVVTAPNSVDRSAGMPAERYLPGEREVILQTVTLKGTGIERTLHYAEDENINYWDYFLSSTDYCSKSYFHFFGLPAGEYEIAITAKGFEPKLKRYIVQPGRPENSRAIELIPSKRSQGTASALLPGT
jgi:pimeloyl-ACP methyl ester carboxylesterase